MDALTTHPHRARADRSPVRHIGLILRPLYARIVGMRPTGPLPTPAPRVMPPAQVTAVQPETIDQDYCERLMAAIRAVAAQEPDSAAVSRVLDENPAAVAREPSDVPAIFSAIEDTAQEEPGTVARARALLGNPSAALAQSEPERQIAWLVALADLKHRCAKAAGIGGTAA